MHATEVQRPGKAARLGDEMRAFAIAALYLAVSFSAVLFHENAVLVAHGIEGRSYWSVIPKALILAKFILLGDALRVGDRLAHRSLLQEMVWRSLSFAVLLIVLIVIEELVVGALHGRGMAETWATLGGGTGATRWASALLLWLILVPYVAARVAARELKTRAAASGVNAA